MVFRRINYRKNTVEMTLFQKYEFFNSDVGYYLQLKGCHAHVGVMRN